MKKINLWLKEHILLIGMICFIIGLFLTLTARPIVDFDYWFHYRLGEHIMATGKIPELGIGSWYAIENNLPWISHEWAFGILIYLLTNMSGENIAQIIAIVLSMLSVLGVFWITRNWYVKHPFIALMVIIAVSLCAMGFTVPRPQLIAYLMTIALVYIIRKAYNENNDKMLLWLIPLTLLWVNFHGGSYILIVLSMLCIIISKCTTFDIGAIHFVKASKKQMGYYLGLLVVILITAMINPHGIEMLTYPLVNMGDLVMINSIQEWQPLNLNNTYNLLCFIFPVITLCCMVANKKKSSIDIALFFMFFLLSIKSVRFVYQLNLICMLMLPTFADFLNEGSLNQLTKIIIASVLLISSVIFGYSGISSINQHFKDGTFYDKSVLLSDEMIEAIKVLDADHLYNNYNYGGQLTYEHIDTWIDGRADIFSKYNLEDEMLLSKSGKNAIDMIKKYKFDAMVVNKKYPLYIQMQLQCELHDDVFTIVYEDDNSILYDINVAAIE